MSIGARSHAQRAGRRRKLKQARTGGLPIDDLRLNLAVRWRQQTAEEKARVRKHAEQQEKEHLAAINGEHPALVPLLEVAVPLWIERLRQLPMAAIEARAGELTDVLGTDPEAFEHTGKREHPARAFDSIDELARAVAFDRSGKPGKGARAFNAIAEGLAALSFGHGGVTWLGMHFEAVHPESIRARKQEGAA